MNIKYRIISVDEKEHSFVVRYYTDILTEDYLTSFFDDEGQPRRDMDGRPERCRSDFNITIYDSNATAEEVDRQIRLAAPADWFRILEEGLTRDPSKPTPALSMVLSQLHHENEFVHVPPPVYEPPVSQPAAVLTDAEIDALLQKLATPPNG